MPGIELNRKSSRVIFLFFYPFFCPFFLLLFNGLAYAGWNQLPVELKEHILQKLPVQNAVEAGIVNQELKQITQRKHFLYPKLLAEFKGHINDLLIKKILAGDFDLIRFLFEEKCVNPQVRNYKTTLGDSEFIGDMSVLELLLDQSKPEAEEPLLAILEKSCLPLTAFYQAEKSIQTLHFAAKKGWHKLSHFFIERAKLSPNQLSQKTQSGWSPLDLSIEYHHPETLELLLKEKHSLAHHTSELTGVERDLPPLSRAAKWGDQPSASLLLKYGGINLLELENLQGELPLFQAFESSHAELVEYFLKMAQDPHAQLQHQGMNFLRWASNPPNFELFEKIKNYYHSTDCSSFITYKGSSDDLQKVGSLLHVLSQDTHQAQLLGGFLTLMETLGCKNEILTLDLWGRTPLHYLADTGDEAMVQVMLKHVPRKFLRVRDRIDGKTPAEFAFEKGHTHLGVLLTPPI
jgi:ankyrin repeat protein